MALLPAACAGDGGEGLDCALVAGSQAASGVVRVGDGRRYEGSFARVQAALVDGVGWRFSGIAPQTQTEIAREGDCVLYEYQPSFCEECFSFCDQGTCIAFPTYLSAGTLTFAIAGQPLTVAHGDPQFLGAAYYAELLQPPSAGQPIDVCAPGDVTAGFTAYTVAVEELDFAVPADDALRMEDGVDLELSWTPPTDPDARVRLTLNANNTSHGVPFPAIIECDAADIGRLRVPRALVDAFPAVDAPEPDPEIGFLCAGSDCPRSELVRYRADRVMLDGLEVEVRGESSVEFHIDHPAGAPQ